MIKPMTQYGLLKISGPDAKKLLQGQLTCDMDEITSDACCFGALCNPQGRVISLFHVFQIENAYFLLLPRNMITLTQDVLKKYAVFFKTTLSDSSDAINTVLNQTVLSILNTRNLQRIEKKIPEIHPVTSGKFLPHDINLHELNAINFDKGCFTGQEIIARMQYRGKLKNHLYLANVTTKTPPIPGVEVYNNESKACGTLVDVSLKSGDTYAILMVTDETNAKSGTLFLPSRDKIQF